MTLTAPPQTPVTEVLVVSKKATRPRKRNQAAATRTLVSAVDLNRHRVAYVIAVSVTLIRSVEATHTARIGRVYKLS